MPSFRQADQPAKDLLREVMEAHHPDLVEVDVRVGLLFAHAPQDPQTGEPKGDALRHQGRAVHGYCKINGLQQRVSGMPDATITVDGDQWPDWDDAYQKALLDHQVCCLVLVRDAEGAVKLDDANRPKLKLREHDFEVRGFFEVMERHREAAPEWQQMTSANQELVQRTLFPMG